MIYQVTVKDKIDLGFFYEIYPNSNGEEFNTCECGELFFEAVVLFEKVDGDLFFEVSELEIFDSNYKNILPVVSAHFPELEVEFYTYVENYIDSKYEKKFAV